jgi:hypothetical protein
MEFVNMNMKDETEMSSEEVKDQDLELEEDEALEVSEEDEETSPAGESMPKGFVPVKKAISLRSRAQRAELEAAQLKGKIEGIELAKTRQEPDPKSPLELEIERQVADGIPEEEVTITAKVYRDQQTYEKQVANKNAQLIAQQERKRKQTASAIAAKAKYDDWHEVIAVGDALLTPGEQLDISNAGADFGETAYQKCKAAIARSKPASKKTNADDETVITTPKNKGGKEKQTPSQEEILAGIEDVDAITLAVAKF